MKHSHLNRREFIQNYGVMAMLLAYLCGFKLDATETDNFGFKLDRTRWNDDTGRMEKALAEVWARHNSPRYSQGLGILQTLMHQAARTEGPDFDPWLSERERKIVAMAIQWLGTNCGCSFLFEASKEMGPRHEAYPFYNPKALN